MRYLIILFGISLLGTSCKNLTPFTQSLYEERQWSESELEQIQFYLSEDVVLERVVTGGQDEIIHGDVKIIDGKKVEIIHIPRKTPGVLAFSPDKQRLAIRFEDGPNQYLMFGPNPKYKGHFMLLAKEWNRRSGSVTYDGQVYKTRDQSQLASLLIDLKKVGRTEVSSRRVDGVKIK